MVRGNPKYWTGKVESLHPSTALIQGRSSLGIFRGTKKLLLKLTFRPEIPANSLIISFRDIKEEGLADAIITVSSAYWKAIRESLSFEEMPNGWDLFMAFIICWNMSAAMLKSMGERGSPCLKRLLWVKKSDIYPFIKTLEEAVVSKTFIQFNHLGGNPLAAMTLNRKSHSIESKALAKSIFRKTACFLEAEMYWRVSLVATKFFIICLSCMNAVWLVEMRSGNLLLNRLANILDSSFGNKLMTLIGQNSLTVAGDLIFDIITTLALFISSRFNWFW